jgi:hypothetical protein
MPAELNLPMLLAVLWIVGCVLQYAALDQEHQSLVNKVGVLG